jgi:uncharacterized RDD family membrane protein YckC
MNPQENINTLTIRTPEGIEFSLLLAGPISRFLAWSVDLLAVLALNKLLNIIFAAAGVISQDVASAASILGYFAVSIGYGIVLEWFWRGQTLGKRLMRLRVTDVHGMQLQFSQVVVRNLLRFVDSLPALYLVGGAACLINRHGQRLGDFAANTIVVWNPPLDEPDLDQLLEGKYNSFRQYPHLEARLRHHLTPTEARIALQALMRRDEIDPGPRVQLFASLASYLKNLVEFPPEATDGISDEQYVRNVVDALFRPKTTPKTV